MKAELADRAVGEEPSSDRTAAIAIEPAEDRGETSDDRDRDHRRLAADEERPAASDHVNARGPPSSAAWISALTGVGPSIASGSQT